MEEEKKNHPSLPSNYVTLAQLQERWLKKHSKTNQPEPEPEPEQPPLQKPQPPSTVSPTNATASASSSHPSKQYRVKKWNNPVTDRGAIKASTEDHRESEAGAGIVGETADQNIKARKFKKAKGKLVKRKPKKKEGKSEGIVDEEEKAEKTALGSELNDEKSGNSTMVEEVEQKFRVLETELGNWKQNARFRNDFRHSQPQRNYHGGRGYGYSRYQRSPQAGVQRNGKMVWVPKDSIVGEVET